MLNLSRARFHAHQSVMWDTSCCMHCMILLMPLSYLGERFFRVCISVAYIFTRWILTVFSFCVSPTKKKKIKK